MGLIKRKIMYFRCDRCGETSKEIHPLSKKDAPLLIPRGWQYKYRHIGDGRFTVLWLFCNKCLDENARLAQE